MFVGFFPVSPSAEALRLFIAASVVSSEPDQVPGAQQALSEPSSRDGLGPALVAYT